MKKKHISYREASAFPHFNKQSRDEDTSLVSVLETLNGQIEAKKEKREKASFLLH